MRLHPPQSGARRFAFEARRRGRRVTGQAFAQTAFGAMRILRLSGLERIHICEEADPPEATAAQDDAS